MMPFKSLLNRLLEDIPGALGAIIIDWEGEAVDQVARTNEYDIKILGAHSGVILNLLREAVKRSGSSDLEHVVIRTGENKIVIAPLTEDYFLVLHLGTEAIVARAIFRTNQCVNELRHEFTFE
jgi:predicted regulator of Ras-like GTPase activity (Roadblock/LC7/MglB family)